MVLFPNEWIAGPNEVRDRVLVIQPDRCHAGCGMVPSEVCGPRPADDGLPPDSAVVERPAPAAESSDGVAAAPPRDPPPGGSPRADPADENR